MKIGGLTSTGRAITFKDSSSAAGSDEFKLLVKPLSSGSASGDSAAFNLKHENTGTFTLYAKNGFGSSNVVTLSGGSLNIADCSTADSIAVDVTGDGNPDLYFNDSASKGAAALTVYKATSDTVKVKVVGNGGSINLVNNTEHIEFAAGSSLFTLKGGNHAIKDSSFSGTLSYDQSKGFTLSQSTGGDKNDSLTLVKGTLNITQDSAADTAKIYLNSDSKSVKFNGSKANATGSATITLSDAGATSIVFKQQNATLEGSFTASVATTSEASDSVKVGNAHGQIILQSKDTLTLTSSATDLKVSGTKGKFKISDSPAATKVSTDTTGYIVADCLTVWTLGSGKATVKADTTTAGTTTFTLTNVKKGYALTVQDSGGHTLDVTADCTLTGTFAVDGNADNIALTSGTASVALAGGTTAWAFTYNTDCFSLGEADAAGQMSGKMTFAKGADAVATLASGSLVVHDGAGNGASVVAGDSSNVKVVYKNTTGNDSLVIKADGAVSDFDSGESLTITKDTGTYVLTVVDSATLTIGKTGDDASKAVTYKLSNSAGAKTTADSKTLKLDIDDVVALYEQKITDAVKGRTQGIVFNPSSGDGDGFDITKATPSGTIELVTLSSGQEGKFFNGSPTSASQVATEAYVNDSSFTLAPKTGVTSVVGISTNKLNSSQDLDSKQVKVSGYTQVGTITVDDGKTLTLSGDLGKNDSFTIRARQGIDDVTFNLASTTSVTVVTAGFAAGDEIKLGTNSFVLGSATPVTLVASGNTVKAADGVFTVRDNLSSTSGTSLLLNNTKIDSVKIDLVSSTGTTLTTNADVTVAGGKVTNIAINGMNANADAKTTKEKVVLTNLGQGVSIEGAKAYVNYEFGTVADESVSGASTDKYVAANKNAISFITGHINDSAHTFLANGTVTIGSSAGQANNYLYGSTTAVGIAGLTSGNGNAKLAFDGTTATLTDVKNTKLTGLNSNKITSFTTATDFGAISAGSSSNGTFVSVASGSNAAKVTVSASGERLTSVSGFGKDEWINVSGTGVSAGFTVGSDALTWTTNATASTNVALRSDGTGVDVINLYDAASTTSVTSNLFNLTSALSNETIVAGTGRVTVGGNVWTSSSRGNIVNSDITDVVKNSAVLIYKDGNDQILATNISDVTLGLNDASYKFTASASSSTGVIINSNGQVTSINMGETLVYTDAAGTTTSYEATADGKFLVTSSTGASTTSTTYDMDAVNKVTILNLGEVGLSNFEGITAAKDLGSGVDYVTLDANGMFGLAATNLKQGEKVTFADTTSASGSTSVSAAKVTLGEFAYVGTNEYRFTLDPKVTAAGSSASPAMTSASATAMATAATVSFVGLENGVINVTGNEKSIYKTTTGEFTSTNTAFVVDKAGALKGASLANATVELLSGYVSITDENTKRSSVNVSTDLGVITLAGQGGVTKEGIVTGLNTLDLVTLAANSKDAAENPYKTTDWSVDGTTYAVLNTAGLTLKKSADGGYYGINGGAVLVAPSTSATWYTGDGSTVKFISAATADSVVTEKGVIIGYEASGDHGTVTVRSLDEGETVVFNPVGGTTVTYTVNAGKLLISQNGTDTVYNVTSTGKQIGVTITGTVGTDGTWTPTFAGTAESGTAVSTDIPKINGQSEVLADGTSMAFDANGNPVSSDSADAATTLSQDNKTVTFTQKDTEAAIDNKLDMSGVADRDVSITTGAGKDDVTLGATDATVSTGKGNDTIAAGAGSAQIDAGDGSNRITLAAGATTVSAGSGSDTLITGAGSAKADLGDGSNKVTVGGAGNANVTTGKGADTFTLSAAAKNATLVSGAGKDTIDATAYSNGTAVLDGNEFAADVVKVASVPKDADALESLVDADGNLTLLDASGTATSAKLNLAERNVVAGTDPNGIAWDDAAVNAVRVQDADGNVVALAWTDNTSATGAVLNGSHEETPTIILGSVNNYADTIYGGNGADTVNAGAGDQVFAGAGNDVIKNKAVSGTVTIDGGTGNNQVFLNSTSQAEVKMDDSQNAVNWIYGFKANETTTMVNGDIITMDQKNPLKKFAINSNGVLDLVSGAEGVNNEMFVTGATDQTTPGGFTANTVFQYRTTIENDNSALGYIKIGVEGTSNTFNYDENVSYYKGQEGVDTMLLSGNEYDMTTSTDRFEGIEVFDATNLTGTAILWGGDTAVANTLVGGSAAKNTFKYEEGQGSDTFILNGTSTQGDVVDLSTIESTRVTGSDGTMGTMGADGTYSKAFGIGDYTVTLQANAQADGFTVNFKDVSYKWDRTENKFNTVTSA